MLVSGMKSSLFGTIATVQTDIVALDSPLFWGAMLLFLGVVSILTYVYSGKDRCLTLFFAVFSLILIALFAACDSLSLYLETHFVGRFDEEGIPFRVSREGWLGLWDAWPFWGLPTIVFSVILPLLAAWGLTHFRRGRPRDISDVPSMPASNPVSTPPPPPRASKGTVPEQMELATLKQSLVTTNDKLAQALLAKSKADSKLEALEKQAEKKAQQLALENTSRETVLSDHIKALELERDVELAEKRELTQQLMLQTEELAKLKALVGKLVKK
jgi:hypothetical protein